MADNTATCTEKVPGFDIYEVGEVYEISNFTGSHITVGKRGERDKRGGYHPIPIELFRKHFESSLFQETKEAS